MTKLMKLYDVMRKQHWTVRIIDEGDRYGRDMCLVQEKSEYGPIVEFYDAAHDHDRGPKNEYLGQFVSRYYIETLLSDDYGGAIGTGRGLDLMGYEPMWKISGPAMDRVAEFCNNYINQ